MRIGMLGGTFNPIHLGHLVLAQECWMRFSLDRVVFIPSYVPPHKAVEEEVSAADRLEMVRLSLEGDDRFKVSSYEIDKEGTSYSIETIEHFKDEYDPDAELFFLTGSDSAGVLSTWKEVDRILDLTTFIIATRPGWSPEGPYSGRVMCIALPLIDVSSTMIRDRIKKGEPIDYLVPVPAVRYIRRKSLYSS